MIKLINRISCRGGKTFKVRGVKFRMIKVSGGTLTVTPIAKEQMEGVMAETKNVNVAVGDFYIGQTQVTQRLWRVVMGDNPSDYRHRPDNPVENVSYNDCLQFVDRLNKLTGETFRLPSEAEWEYAAKGGKANKDYVYAGSNSASKVAWFDENSGNRTHKVAQKKPNSLGVYDMCGNVSEWVADRCEAYEQINQDKGITNNNNTGRILRGGNYASGIEEVQLSFRETFPADQTFDVYGLRLAL